MDQALMRRYKRQIQSESAALPNLVIIDGGEGQLSVEKNVFQKLNILKLVILMSVSTGIKHREGKEYFFLINRTFPVCPEVDSPALHLVQRIRDEAHRFTIYTHRKKRENRE